MTGKNDKSKTSAVDENLRRAFSAALEPEVPDRFRDLIDNLRAQEQGFKRSDDGSAS